MHTTTITITGSQFVLESDLHHGETFTVHHSGDYSGDVWITLEGARVEDLGEVEPDVRHYLVKIPFDVLKELVTNYARVHAIETLEQASSDELLERI